MSVFFRSIATVIGPTPPGTGVIKPAFFFTSKRKEKKVLTKNVFKNIGFFSSVAHTRLTGNEHKGLRLGKHRRIWEKLRQKSSYSHGSDRIQSGPGLQGSFLHLNIITQGLVLGHGFTTCLS